MIHPLPYCYTAVHHHGVHCVYLLRLGAKIAHSPASTICRERLKTSRRRVGGRPRVVRSRVEPPRWWHKRRDTDSVYRVHCVFSTPTPPHRRGIDLPKFSLDSIPGRGRVHRSRILIYRLVGFRNPTRNTGIHEREPCPRTTGSHSSSSASPTLNCPKSKVSHEYTH